MELFPALLEDLRCSGREAPGVTMGISAGFHYGHALDVSNTESIRTWTCCIHFDGFESGRIAAWRMASFL